MNKEIAFDKSFKHSQLFRDVNVKSSNFLALFIGSFRSAEAIFFEDFKKVTGLDLVEYDMNDLIFDDEEKTKSRIDSFFSSLPKQSNALIIRNADRLNGAFTGNSISSIRYATPQEKYFLASLYRSETIMFLDYSNRSNIIPTFRRHAHLIVDFTGSRGIMSRVLGRFNLSLLGGRFDTKTMVITR